MSVVEAGGEGLTERQEVISVAAELGTRELAPRSLQLDERSAGALERAWDCVTDVGFDRALLGVDDGGVGLDSDSFLCCLEEIAAGEAGVAVLVLLANAAYMAMGPERATAVGATERWALVPAPSGRISLGACGADGLVIVEAGSETGARMFRADSSALTIEPCAFQLGLRSAASAVVSFAAGADGEAQEAPGDSAAAESSLVLLRAGSAAICRGLARRGQELALAYAKTRIQGGVPIIEHDAVRNMLAKMSVRRAATALPAGCALDASAALAAKVAASEAALATSTDAVQVYGGAGYMHESGVEKLMRDAKYLQLWPDANWLADEELIGAERAGR